MKLVFRGHDDRYAVEQSLLAFFPEERPVYQEPEPGEDNWARVDLHQGPVYATAVTEIAHGGRLGRGTSRALLRDAPVLLLDEATSALDPISTSKIEDLALELKEHYTVVMVTHNMQQAARISDNTAFFLLGELVEFGRTEQLFSAPADKRTEDYITGRFG